MLSQYSLLLAAALAVACQSFRKLVLIPQAIKHLQFEVYRTSVEERGIVMRQSCGGPGISALHTQDSCTAHGADRCECPPVGVERGTVNMWGVQIVLVAC